MSQHSQLVTSDNHRSFCTDCYQAYHQNEQPVPKGTTPSLSGRIRRATFRALAGRRGKRSSEEKIDGRRIHRIALLRYDAVGDYIISTPLLRWLRMALPHAEVDVISSYRNDSLVAPDPYVSRHYPISPQFKLLHPSLLPLHRATRERDYDLLLALSTDRMTRAAIVARAVAPAAEKIGLVHRERQDIYGQVFTRQVDHHRWLEHWGQTILRMATETIEPVEECRPDAIRQHIAVSQEAWNGAQKFLRGHELRFAGFTEGIIPGRGWEGDLPGAFDGAPYCVLNISAHCKERQWSPERCAHVCRLMLERFPELQLFVTGAPADTSDVATTVALVGHRRCRPVALRLHEFVPFVAGADLVITPDTATLHIAATAGCPVVGLYAEKIKACEWYPAGTRFALLVSPSEESINLIEPEEVVAAAEVVIGVEYPAVGVDELTADSTTYASVPS